MGFYLVPRLMALNDFEWLFKVTQSIPGSEISCQLLRRFTAAAQ